MGLAAGTGAGRARLAPGGDAGAALDEPPASETQGAAEWAAAAGTVRARRRRPLAELLAETGFTEVSVEGLELVRRHATFEEFWDTTLDISRQFHDAAMSPPEPQLEAVRDGLRRRLAPYTGEDGTLQIPGRTLVAKASA